MANLKGDLWFILQFPFRQRMRPITQMKNISAVSQSGRHLKFHQKKKKEEEVRASSHDSVFWQDILNPSETQTLFRSQFSSPALIMSKAAAAEAESCCVIPPDRPIPPLAASLAQLSSSQCCLMSRSQTDGATTQINYKNTFPLLLYWPLRVIRMHCFDFDGKQKYPNDDLKKWKIPNGEVRGLLPFSSGFLSLSLSFLLNLPSYNLSPSATAAWL